MHWLGVKNDYKLQKKMLVNLKTSQLKLSKMKYSEKNF